MHGTIGKELIQKQISYIIYIIFMGLFCQTKDHLDNEKWNLLSLQSTS